MLPPLNDYAYTYIVNLHFFIGKHAVYYFSLINDKSVAYRRVELLGECGAILDR